MPPKRRAEPRTGRSGGKDGGTTSRKVSQSPRRTGRRGKKGSKSPVARVKHAQPFSLNAAEAKIPEYNSLFDGNMRHYYENKNVQRLLYKAGLIDKMGRVIDMDKNKAKLYIIEQEFKMAEKAEYWRLREEEELRRRLMIKRQRAIEEARNIERIAKLKEDRRIRQELIRARTGLMYGVAPSNSKNTVGSDPAEDVGDAKAEEVDKDQIDEILDQAEQEELRKLQEEVSEAMRPDPDQEAAADEDAGEGVQEHEDLAEVPKDEQPTLKRPLRVVIAGPPASGKGTQCEFIVEEFGLVHLSTGDMLRAEVAAESDIGVQVKDIMAGGGLVSDELIIEIVRRRLEQDDCHERGFLLDGFPRTAAQADALAEAGIEIDKFVLLECEDDTVIQRCTGRRMDPETGKIYHMTFNPPPDDPEIIDRLVHRKDDTEEAIRPRLELYHANVESIASKYSKQLCKFDSNLERDEVYGLISQYLNLHGDEPEPEPEPEPEVEEEAGGEDEAPLEEHVQSNL